MVCNKSKAILRWINNSLCYQLTWLMLGQWHRDGIASGKLWETFSLFIYFVSFICIFDKTSVCNLLISTIVAFTFYTRLFCTIFVLGEDFTYAIISLVSDSLCHFCMFVLYTLYLINYCLNQTFQIWHKHVTNEIISTWLERKLNASSVLLTIIKFSMLLMHWYLLTGLNDKEILKRSVWSAYV